MRFVFSDLRTFLDRSSRKLCQTSECCSITCGDPPPEGNRSPPIEPRALGQRCDASGSERSPPSSPSNSSIFPGLFRYASIETFGEARVAEALVHVAAEGDQAELPRRKPLAETTTQFYPVHA